MKTNVCSLRDCTGCGLCLQLCPRKAITMVADEEGFQYPQINHELCTECNLCSQKCIANTVPIFNTESSKYYMAWNKDEAGRKTGSSGGVFHALAKSFIQAGGLVCGAKFINPHKLEHVLISSVNEIEPLCGSKYIPSEAYHIYKDIKEALSKGKKILFIGTPCQVDSLYRYCGHHHLLYTCDLVCYGVGSKAFWDNYIDDIEKKYSSKCTEIYFRKKIYGSRNASMIIKFENGAKESEIFNLSLFGLPFAKKWIGRNVCYNCQYAVRERVGDLTLGDYTGNDLCDQTLFNIKRGVSLCRSNTEKGERLLESANVELISKDELFIQKSASRQMRKKEETDQRDLFMRDFLEYGFDFVKQKYYHVGIVEYLMYRFDSFLMIARRVYRKFRRQ